MKHGLNTVKSKNALFLYLTVFHPWLKFLDLSFIDPGFIRGRGKPLEGPAVSSLSLRRLNGHTAGLWKLDYMLATANPTDDEPYVLRIWCSSGEGSRPFGAERLASESLRYLEREIEALT